MVLVALERVELEALEIRLRAMEKAAILGHLLEEERVGVVDDGQVHLSIGEQTLELVKETGVLPEGKPGAFEEDAQVDVASRMDVSRDG